MSSELDRLRRGSELPFALGDLVGKADSPRYRLRMRRRLLNGVCVVLGAAAAIAGVVAATEPPEANVYTDAQAVHVGGAVLLPDGPGVWSGDAALVLQPGANGAVTAAGAAQMGGKAVTGVCQEHVAASGLAERCQFTVGLRQVSSTDTYASRSRRWARVYSDGLRVVFVVPAGTTAVPIPFPMGEHS